MILTFISRGVSLYGALLGAIAMLLYTFAGGRFWAGEWQGGVQAVTNALVLALPVVFFCSAVDYRRLMRIESGGGASNIVRRDYPIWIATAAMLPWAAALTALILIVSAYNSGVSAFHFPGVPPLLMPFAWIFLYVCLGQAFARRVPVVFLAPLAIVFGFIGPIFLAAEPDTLGSLFTPVDDGAVSPPILLRQDVVLVQLTLCVLGALACLTFGNAVRSSGSSKWTRVLLVGGLALSVAMLVVLGPERRHVVAAADGPKVCESSGDTSVCVWSDHSRLLPRALEAWSRIRQAVPLTKAEMPSGFVESGLRMPQGWREFGTGSAESSVEEVARSMALEVARSSGCRTGSRPRSVNDADPASWILYRAQILGDDQVSAAVRELADLPQESQLEWWREEMSDQAECSTN